MSVEIREVDAQGAVSRLVVRNAGPLPVLIIDGDILLGLKQDRVLNTTILVPSQSTLEIPVSCVEAGRWRPRSATARRGDFSVSPGVRAAKLKSMILRTRASGKFDSDQLAIWKEVEKYVGSLGVQSETQAYSDIERQRRPQIDERLAQLKPADGQSGVLAAVGGKPISFDLFDKPSTLSRFWQGLI
ncbi:MAG: TIGR02452 family protein, partial [Chloroflexi bacterium]